MDFTQKMYGIFNVETKELLRGPFRSVRGAANSKSAVVDGQLQGYYLRDGKDYNLFLSWHRGIDRAYLVQRYTQQEVDHIFEKYEEFKNMIQVRPVMVTMGEPE